MFAGNPLVLQTTVSDGDDSFSNASKVNSKLSSVVVFGTLQSHALVVSHTPRAITMVEYS
jgi:hypothetical protein